MRRAARGDGEAFEELYRRHGQVGWRFAQAVAADKDAAVQAVAEGFGRALRGLRRYSRMDAEGFRPFVLAAIYRAAVDNLQAHAAPTPVAPLSHAAPAKGRTARARAADAAFVEAAFRSLPERWRATIWLSEVEGMTEDRIAPVLGVSAAVATQLVSRSYRGLAGRFEQGRRPMPDHLDSALRPLSDAVPAGLGKSVGERWAALVSDPRARFAPLTEWMSERAVRPLWVSVGGLMGLSLIGLGLVAQNTGVNSGPVASGGLPGSVNYPGINPAFSRGFNPITPGSGLNPFNLSSSSTGGSGSSLSGPSAGFPAGGPTSPGTGGNNSLLNPPPAPPPNTGGILPQLPPPPAPPSTSNPLISTTTSGSTTNVNVLPTSSGGSTATVSLGCSTGVGLTVSGTQIGCTSPTGSTSTSTSSGTLSTTTTTLSTITSGL